MSVASTGFIDRQATDLDPQIERFIEMMGTGWAKHPSLETLPFPEARKVAEAVREPWTRGGPVMASTSEIQVPVSDGCVRIRVHVPDRKDRPKSALVYLHGGGWTIFSINTHDRLMREYAGRAGICVVGVDYSLSPEVRYPRALEETVAVVRWLRDHCAELGIDGAKIATGGDSAGANLAISAAIALRDAGESTAIAALLLNYGAFDNDCQNKSYRRFGGPGYMLGGSEMDEFWKNYLADRYDEKHPLAVPLHANLTDLPPTFLCIPDCDVLLDENIAMAARLRAAGVEVTDIIYRGASHSFLEAVSIAAISDRALDDASNWLRETLEDSD